ncbi:hypothetical protein L2E82_14082 [Cichorium intybus]|uniref:Uncharacterized protein n=1 Tax=Cichorium intybus TaxID=13427 RepID=A0ACB9F096_CICIN|nr:hypothetical protein L2E82_14082 [Cichorium intybus]
MEAENIVPIDLDSDSVSNVDIAKPENLEKKPRASKRLKSNKNFPLKTYIYIDDDDDDDDDSHKNHHAGTNTEGDSKFNESSKHFPVKLSKSKRTYPERGPSNFHGFSKQSNGDNGYECEFIADSKGMLQKLWNKASLKKKASVQSESDCKKVINENSKSKETPTDGALVEGSIVNEREKALKVQAEEAQRLLKRKEAEKLRLLDMEKRQKQRVEEIRQIKKKEKENMKLKEIYRTKVQYDLKNLEMTCHDMASLLRGLGILVDDGSYASSHQIRAAYKRALLKFHPDRASGSDMHQQVEAEEKFKLISRMRDKFL